MNNLELFKFLSSKNLPEYIKINTLLVTNKIIDSFLISWKFYDNFPTNPKLLNYLDIVTYNIKVIKVIKYPELNGYLVTLSETEKNKCKSLSQCFEKNVFNYPVVYDEINFGIKVQILYSNIQLLKFCIKNSEQSTHESYITNIFHKISTFCKNELKLTKLIYIDYNTPWFSKKYILKYEDDFLINNMHIYILRLIENYNFNQLKTIFFKNPEKMNNNKMIIRILIGYIQNVKKQSNISEFDKFLVNQLI